MRIDSHQHFWNYDPQTYAWINEDMSKIRKSFAPADLKPLLDACDLDACISVQVRQAEIENTYMMDLAQKHKFIQGIVGWVDFRSDRVEERLAHYAQYPILKGFRHIVQDEPNDEFLLQKSFIEGVKKCKGFKHLYEILIFEKHLPATLRFLDHFEGQAFVLDHIAKPTITKGLTKNWEDGIRRVAQYPHISCKVSAMVTEAHWNRWSYEDFVPYLDIVVDAFGMDRLMYGSDWPVSLLAAETYEAVYGIVSRYFQDFSEEDQAKFFGLNALRVYNL